MRFEVFRRQAAQQRCDCLVIGAFEHSELGAEAQAVDRALHGRVHQLLVRGVFSGRIGETLLIPQLSGLAAPRLLLVGLGPRAQFNRRAWRRALTAATGALARTRLTTAAVALERPASPELDDYYFGRAIADLVGQGLYRINALKSARRERAPALARVLVGPLSADAAASVRRGLEAGAALAESARLLRDVANLPGNVCTPRYLAARAREVAREHRGRMRVRVLDEAAIRRQRMGCLLAVTRGSAEPPRFIVLEYRGARRNRAPLVLVGKGVTFDSGGISLKEPPAMDEMKFDMCGAATVLAALDYAARAQLRLNVVGLMPACENMPGARAVKPGDIVTSASGQTVEVLNTDAEGRLILSDALNYARRFRPETVIDFATLTGACVIALGNHHSAVMGNDETLESELVAAGLRTDDRAWRLPLTEEYAEQLRSNFADFANVAGREGGAITAAAFLGKFTQGMRWAHLDIAGTAWTSGANKGASGRPLPLVADFLTRRAESARGR